MLFVSRMLFVVGLYVELLTTTSISLATQTSLVPRRPISYTREGVNH